MSEKGCVSTADSNAASIVLMSDELSAIMISSMHPKAIKFANAGK